MKVRGFTLMEMVMTIVIGSIITLGITSFIRIGMTGYADTIQRQRLQSQAQFVIEKMSREIRHAVPNSFEIVNGCLQFMPIAYSGFYSFSSDDIQFIIGSGEIDENNKSNLRLVINPTRFDDLSSASHSVDLNNFDLNDDVYSGSRGGLTSTSVSNRHYIYEPSKEIKYCFADLKEVTREQHGTEATIADNVDPLQSYFKYSEASLHRGGLVHIHLEFEQDGERSVYQHDVQVLNVP